MKNGMDRRSFLKRSAAAAVLVPAAALLTGCDYELKDLLLHMMGQGSNVLDTKARLGSCTVQLLQAGLDKNRGEVSARFRVTNLPAELQPVTACTAKADRETLRLLSASQQSLAPGASSQEVTLKFALSAAQGEKLSQQGTLHFTLSAFGYRVEYLVDCPAMTILTPSVSGPSL